MANIFTFTYFQFTYMMEIKSCVFTPPPLFSTWTDGERYCERRTLREWDKEKDRGTNKVKQKAKREKWWEKERHSLRRSMIEREKLENCSDHFPSSNILCWEPSKSQLMLLNRCQNRLKVFYAHVSGVRRQQKVSWEFACNRSNLLAGPKRNVAEICDR